MLGEDSDEEEMDTAERKGNTSSQDDEMGCTWGMGKALKLLPEVNKSVSTGIVNFKKSYSFHDSLRKMRQIQFAHRLPKLRFINFSDAKKLNYGPN